MPRLKPSPQEMCDRELVATIQKYLTLRGRKESEMYKILRCCPTTACSRMKLPEKFNVEELRHIKHSLQIPAEELIKGILGA